MEVNPLVSLSGSDLIQERTALDKDIARTDSFRAELDKAAAAGNDEKLMEAAKEFESYFINMLYKQMRSTINYTGGLFERSAAEVTFQDMLDEQYSAIATESGGIGLAEHIYEQMKQDNADTVSAAERAVDEGL
jgi:flagellar protein FlgJ